MSKYIKVFDTFAEYQAYTRSSEFISPNFSYVINEDETYYDRNEKRYYSNWMDVMPQPSSTTLNDLRTYVTQVELPKQVTAIGNNLMPGFTSVKSVEIPSGVTSLGYQTFYNCTSLEDVTMPDGITSFGYSTFAQCSSLKRVNSNTDGVVNLPTGLTTVGSAMCRNCTSIVEVNIPGTLANTGTHAFSACTNLTTANFESGTTTIGTNCFQGCTKLTTVNLPDGLKNVNNASFQGCTSLSSITIPTSVTVVGSAFYGCNKLKSCEIPSGAVTTYVNTFYGCSQLSSLTINSPITSITSGYCQGCTALKRLNSDTDGVYNIPSTVVRLGRNCFLGNKALVELNIPDSTIGELSTAHTAWFSGCSALNKVDIGTGLTKIAVSGFCACGTIQSFTIRSTTPPTIGTNAFKSTTLTNIYVPYDAVDTYKSASGWSSYAEKIQPIPETIPDGG